jgi:4-aminobutyrate aminotransferase / (S)-3-amino-2-methylpropionate transaminase / 5-aminovalerate transaminase
MSTSTKTTTTTTPTSATPSKQSDLLARRAAAVPRGPFNVAPIFAARASGVRIWDVEGREYLDFCGGIGVQNVGHNHPRVVEAVKAQADQFLHTCWHVVMYEPYVRLAERLNERVPIPGPKKTVLFNSGAEATENAVKIARASTGRQAVLSFERGFHGRTLLALTMTGKVKPYSEGFGPFAPEVYRLPYEPFFGGPERSDAQAEKEARSALDHVFSYQIEPKQIAVIIMEPVLGEGGFIPAHPAAMRAARSVARDSGILFAADEVQTGFGRTGAWFAFERYDIQPDMVLMAKSLAAGLPLSAITAGAAILDAPQVGGLGGTYGGNPLACAAANAVLDIMEEEGLPAKALAIGEKIMARFRALQKKHAFVVDARGLGAMCGLELDTAARANRVLKEALDRGLLLMTANGNVIRTLMPLVIGEEDLTRGLDVLEEALAAAG